MSDQPLVTVVMATNRVSPFLAEAVSSVAAQSWPRVELVVVDDGSPDPVAIDDAVAGIPGARVLHRPARGVSAARNLGVASSNGELLAFIDDDDRWHPRRLELHVEAMSRQPDAVVSYCKMATIDASGTQQLAPADQIAVASRLDVARRLTAIIAPNIVVRRTAFDAAGGFRPELSRAEDLDLVLSLAELGATAFVPHALVDYRFTGMNVTSNHRELGIAIADVLRRHRAGAAAHGDAELVAALRESQRKNARYIWWASLRAARTALRGAHPLRAAAEVWGAVRSAPQGLALGILHRLRSS